MDLRKRPLLRCLSPFSGELVPVRIVTWDKARKVAHVIDPAGDPRTVPLSWFVLAAPEDAA